MIRFKATIAIAITALAALFTVGAGTASAARPAPPIDSIVGETTVLSAAAGRSVPVETDARPLAGDGATVMYQKVKDGGSTGDGDADDAECRELAQDIRDLQDDAEAAKSENSKFVLTSKAEDVKDYATDQGCFIVYE